MVLSLTTWEKYFKNDGDGSKYVKIIAIDQSNILKNISTIPFYHTKDVALDYLFLDTDIMEIIPDFIGTYEEKYSSLVITNKQQHDDDFLYFHWKLYVKNQKDVGKFVHFQWFFFHVNLLCQILNRISPKTIFTMPFFSS
jgi:hypothetical protein